MSPATEVLRELDRVVASAGPAERPTLALALSSRLSTLAADMAAQPMAPPAPEIPAEPKEHWLSTDQALEVLGGKFSRKFLYRRTHGMKFRKDFTRKNVLWEEAGLRRWIASRRS